MTPKSYMPGLIVCVVTGSLLAWFSSPVSGRMYRYRDKEGMVHFTDNLTKIPQDLLPGVEPLGPGRADSMSGRDLTPAQSENTPPSDEEDGIRTGGSNDQGSDPPIVERLNREKAALDAEHGALMRAKAALEREKATLKTPEEVRAYQKKVKALNRRIDAYGKRNREYAKQVDAYNAALKEDME